MRHCEDHEICARQQLVQCFGPVQFRDAIGRRRPACVSPQHGNAECRQETRRLGTDPADTHNQRRRFRQVHHVAVFCRTFLPLAPELLRNEDMKPACEGQHKSQDVGADVVVEDLCEASLKRRLSF